MKILLIGKTGQLGGDLLRNNTQHEIFAPDKNDLELSDFEQVKKILCNYKPDIVINTAAFHNVPLCEKEYSKAFQINCVALAHLAKVCRHLSCKLISFSTDYVFDGLKKTPYLENDQTHPLQVYGITKLAGEHLVFAEFPEQSYIIRTCGLYGLSGAKSKGGNFVDQRIEDAKNCKVIEMNSAQTVCPTYTDDLSTAVFKMIENQEVLPGLYHLVNEGECSWYEFTKEIYQMMNIEIELKPVERKYVEAEVRRPSYSVLKNQKASSLGIVLPHWKEALRRYLRTKYVL